MCRWSVWLVQTSKHRLSHSPPNWQFSPWQAFTDSRGSLLHRAVMMGERWQVAVQGLNWLRNVPSSKYILFIIHLLRKMLISFPNIRQNVRHCRRTNMRAGKLYGISYLTRLAGAKSIRKSISDMLFFYYLKYQPISMVIIIIGETIKKKLRVILTTFVKSDKIFCRSVNSVRQSFTRSYFNSFVGYLIRF